MIIDKSVTSVLIVGSDTLRICLLPKFVQDLVKAVFLRNNTTEF